MPLINLYFRIGCRSFRLYKKSITREGRTRLALGSILVIIIISNAVIVLYTVLLNLLESYSEIPYSLQPKVPKLQDGQAK